MLYTQPVTVAEPVLVTGTDLRVTYEGPDRPSLVERVAGAVVFESFLVAPYQSIVLRRPYDTDWPTWSVTFEPCSPPDRALVHIIEGPIGEASA